MDAPRVPSSAEKFKRPSTMVFALPVRNGDGEELVVKIKAVPPALVMALWGGLPSMKTAAQAAIEKAAGIAEQPPTEDDNAKAIERIHAVVTAAAISPLVGFGDPVISVGDGAECVNWDDVHPENQRAWLGAIAAHSGLVPTEKTAEALSFRVLERGGVTVLGGTGGPGAVGGQAPA